jgi:hypothetical protein
MNGKSLQLLIMSVKLVGGSTPRGTPAHQQSKRPADNYFNYFDFGSPNNTIVLPSG